MLTDEKIKELRKLAESDSKKFIATTHPQTVLMLLDELRAQVEKLKDAWEIVVEKNMELEAQAAVLQYAIDTAISEGLRERISEVDYSYGDGSLADLVLRRILYAFDTTDAGREMLERIRKLEQVAEITRVYKDIVDSLIYSLNADWKNKNEYINVIYSWLKRIEDVKIELNKALAALEGGSI